MQLTLRYGLQSERGLRPNNEDTIFAGPRLLALADGVGGHAAGEVAAALAIAELVPLNRREPSRDLLADLALAVDRANSAIAQRAASDAETKGMGTTLTAILFAGNRLGLVHIGDSRAYLLRNGLFTQITKDDTLIQYLLDEGRLSPEEAWCHPRRSVVLKALNGEPVVPFLDVREVDPGDRYLICSDGLTDYVPPDVISEALRALDLRRCPQELIRLALQRGSQDNISCTVADVTEGDSGYNIAILEGASGYVAEVVQV